MEYNWNLNFFIQKWEVSQPVSLTHNNVFIRNGIEAAVEEYEGDEEEEEEDEDHDDEGEEDWSDDKFDDWYQLTGSISNNWTVRYE